MFLIKKFIRCGAFALALLSNSIIYCQTHIEYSGPLTVGEFQGKAHYTYRLEQGDTIFDGAFRLQQSNIERLLSGKDDYFLFKGSFKGNVPVGNWEFSIAQFAVDAIDHNEVVDNFYKVKTKGVIHKTKGELLEGKPHGEWKHTMQKVRGSEVAETGFESVIEFKKGIPQRNFKIQTKSQSLMGRFLRDGLAHDVWELFTIDSPNAVEKWFFADGRLQKITKENDGVLQTIDVYTNAIDTPKILNLDGRYLEILKLKQLLDNDRYVDLEGGMNELLEENSKYYHTTNNILSELGEYSFMPEFKVKVAHYPLTKEELKQLDSITKLFDQCQEINEVLLNSTQLKILKLSNEEVLFHLGVLQEMQKSYLTVIEDIVAYHKMNVLGFVQRDSLLDKLSKGEGKPSPSLNIRYEIMDSAKVKSYTGANASQYDFKQTSIAGVEQLADYTFNNITAIQAILNEKTRRQEIEDELKELEEILIEEVTALNKVVDSLSANNIDNLSNSFKNIKHVAKKELSRYSAIADIEGKAEEARTLIQCFKTLNELALMVSTLPSRAEEIKQLYTDGVWNPFTATVITEQVKRHITNAYNNVLVVFILNYVEKNISCNNVEALIGTSNKVYERILELRDVETIKLERKLKKEHDPWRVMELLNITTGLKEIEQ